jgi:hypothetical protein
MSNSYEWGKDINADAQRILTAGLPGEFWRDIAAIYDDALATAHHITRYDILGDTLEIHPSYVVLFRNEKRIRRFSHKKTVGVAYKLRKAEKIAAKAQAQKAGKDSRIIWDTE